MGINQPRPERINDQLQPSEKKILTMSSTTEDMITVWYRPTKVSAKTVMSTAIM